MDNREHHIELEAGTVLDNRYEVVSCLGNGSVGTVYKCLNKEFAPDYVAVKVLSPKLITNKTAVVRFRNELVAAYGVNHINVVKPFELFRHKSLLAFSMEYIDGGDLGRLMAAEDKFGFDETVHFLSQIAEGLSAIHRAGIIHRDLKPENVLLTHDGVAKICDFGTARLEGGPRITEKGSVIGTINYLSPEYIENGAVDVRSDIYSFGVMAYEMISGRMPFRGDSIVETMHLKLNTDPVPLVELCAGCSPVLSGIVSKAMRRSPDERFQSVLEIQEKLNGLKAIPAV